MVTPIKMNMVLNSLVLKYFFLIKDKERVNVAFVYKIRNVLVYWRVGRVCLEF